MNNRTRLIQIAANLVSRNLSGFKEDYPKSTPVSVVRMIEARNRQLVNFAVELRKIADNTFN